MASARLFGGRPDSAAKFFTASLACAQAPFRAKNARMLGLCYINANQLEKAEDYLEIAEQKEPDTVLCALLRLEIALMRNDDGGAMREVRRLPSTVDFYTAHLQVNLKGRKDI